MTHDIIRVTDDFWNIRGSYKIGGIVDVGTQTSLVRRANGKFLFLDAYTLDDSVRREVFARTRDGQDVEAILNLHPFHTLHVRAMHREFPSARLYGTARHRSQLPELAWEQALLEDPATHALFARQIVLGPAELPDPTSGIWWMIVLSLVAAVALIRFKANLLLVLAACALAGLAAHASGL